MLLHLDEAAHAPGHALESSDINSNAVVNIHLPAVETNIANVRLASKSRLLSIVDVHDLVTEENRNLDHEVEKGQSHAPVLGDLDHYREAGGDLDHGRETKDLLIRESEEGQHHAREVVSRHYEVEGHAVVVRMLDMNMRDEENLPMTRLVESVMLQKTDDLRNHLAALEITETVLLIEAAKGILLGIGTKRVFSGIHLVIEVAVTKILWLRLQTRRGVVVMSTSVTELVMTR